MIVFIFYYFDMEIDNTNIPEKLKYLMENFPLQVFPTSCRKYCNFKNIFYQVNYNCSGITLIFRQIA